MMNFDTVSQVTMSLLLLLLLLNAFVPYADGLIVGADGIPWWSPSRVLATNYCVCKCMCVRVTCLVFIIAVHLVNKVIIYQLTTQTLQVAVSSTVSHRPF